MIESKIDWINLDTLVSVLGIINCIWDWYFGGVWISRTKASQIDIWDAFEWVEADFFYALYSKKRLK